MSRADAAGILRRHFREHCPEPFSVEPVEGAAINSRNFRVLREGRPCFILKRSAPSPVAAVYAELSRRSALLPSMVAQASEAGELYRLIEYREGEAGAGGAAAAGRALAELHLALRDAPGALPFSERYLPLPNAAAAMKELPDWYADIAALEAQAGLPRGWVHHDYHPGNVLFREARVSAILDMDALGGDFRMQAVAFGASRFGEPREFLAAYDALDPLTPAEKAGYARFVRREAVRRINWILRDPGGAWRGDLDKHLATIRAHAS